jgi:hypothetical protein
MEAEMSNTSSLPLTDDDHAAYHASAYKEINYADCVRGLRIIDNKANRESHRAWLEANVPSIHQITTMLGRCGIKDRHEVDSALIILLARECFGLVRKLDDVTRKLEGLPKC